MLRQLRRISDRHRHGHGPFAHLFMPYEGSDVIAIDCETTGLDSRHAELVSIAAVPVKQGRVLTSQALDIKLAAPDSLEGSSIRIHRLRPVDLDEGSPWLPRWSSCWTLSAIGPWWAGAWISMWPWSTATCAL